MIRSLHDILILNDANEIWLHSILIGYEGWVKLLSSDLPIC